MENSDRLLHSILIINDDVITRFLIHLNVEEAGLTKEIITASDGLEALELLAKTLHFPELIFLDLKMPVMDGIEFLEKFHLLYSKKNTRIIITTASLNNRDRQALREFNIFRFLENPITKEEILDLWNDLRLRRSAIENINDR